MRGSKLFDARLIDACEINATSALRYFALASGGEVRDEQRFLLAANSHPYCGTFHNGATRTDRGLDPEVLLDQARDFFGARQRDFVLWLSKDTDVDLEKAARKRGMLLRKPADGAPGMCVTTPLPAVSPPPEVRLVPVTSADQTETFARVVADAYSVREEPAGQSAVPAADGAVSGAAQPPEAVFALFRDPDALVDPRVFALLAYRRGEPAAGAMLFRSGDVAGLYWVSTVPGARRRGLADLVTRAVTNEGFARGARVVVLQASPMGAPLYRRMGFVEVTRHRRYVSAAAPTAGH
ncbi:hypothetical protein GCM10027575_64820 [Phytohabitans suffuscus]